MPGLRFALITNMAFKATENAVIVRGQSSKGEVIEAEFPLDAFARLSAQSLRAALVQDRLAAGERKDNGAWAQIVPVGVRTADIGWLDMETPPTVALVFDRGQPTELSFRLTDAMAENVGRRLISASERSTRTSSPPST